jgi:Transposase DDE domain
LRRLAEGRDELEIRFGRLLRNPSVTVEGIVAGWSEETVPAVAGRHVLAIQDSSEINFRTSPDHTRGLGTIGKGVGRGLILHPMIAVDAASKECLGLVGGALWSRDEEVQAKPAKRSAGKRKKAAGKEKARKRKKKRSGRPLAEKESRHWIETAQKAKSVLSQAAQVTMVADREADIYEMWALVPSPNVHVLGRAYQDRNLVGGATLTTAAADWPVLGTRRITIRERDDRPEREADIALRAGLITIPRPRSVPKAGVPDQVTLTLIELTEPNPPEGAEPVVWRLLTTHAVPDAAMAWQVVDWYRARWIIEQYFRTLKKQGLQIEDSQVETADRLLKLVAIAARAAVIIMQLTQARDGTSTLAAPLVFSPAEIATLEALDKSYANHDKLARNLYPPHSLSWASWIIARLGGWNGREKSKPPGPITFKNGLDALRHMAQGWLLRVLYIP